MDSRLAVRAVRDHQALFGKSPTSYAYDRAGSSEKNVFALKGLGVSHVGLAPRGRAKWRVRGRVKNRLIWVQIGSHPDWRIPIWFRDVTDCKLPGYQIHK